MGEISREPAAVGPWGSWLVGPLGPCWSSPEKLVWLESGSREAGLGGPHPGRDRAGGGQRRPRTLPPETGLTLIQRWGPHPALSTGHALCRRLLDAPVCARSVTRDCRLDSLHVAEVYLSVPGAESRRRRRKCIYQFREPNPGPNPWPRPSSGLQTAGLPLTPHRAEGR